VAPPNGLPFVPSGPCWPPFLVCARLQSLSGPVDPNVQVPPPEEPLCRKIYLFFFSYFPRVDALWTSLGFPYPLPLHNIPPIEKVFSLFFIPPTYL